ncbi:UNVERIFIED_CONTAM: hypothetical protein NCL1_45599 [Trichonephila clavipes]
MKCLFVKKCTYTLKLRVEIENINDTGEVLLPSDLKKFQEYGGKKIYVTDDEAKQIRHFDSPGKCSNFIFYL